MQTSNNDNTELSADYKYYSYNKSLISTIDGKRYQTISLRGESEINFSAGERYVVVKVRGDSMNKVNIDDGDFVLVVMQDTAENGDIVVAEFNNGDFGTTLKRYHIQNRQITLSPESSNSDHQAFATTKSDLKILGIAVAVFKPELLEENIVIIHPNILRIRLVLPNLMQVGDFSDAITDRLWAIEFMYSFYTILSSQNQNAIEELLKFIKQYRRNTIGNRFSLNAILALINIEALKLSSLKYGSPATFDLLGISNILVQVRDTIKDISWKAEHERKTAEVELDKLKLETEKIAVEIAKEKIGLIERASQLKLSSLDKTLLISALAHEINMLDISTSIPLLPSGQTKSTRAKTKNKSNKAKKIISNKKYTKKLKP